MTRVMWNLILVHLGTALRSVHDGCMVCTERTIGSEIILDAPDELLGDVGHVEPRFDPFGDSVSVGAR